MRIAVDALGGDHAPKELVAGAVEAAGALPQDEILLVGSRISIGGLLGPEPPLNISLIEADGAIGMSENPAAALRARPESSVSVAANAVRNDSADAFFSAGSTGATVAAALLKVGRSKACRRPGIATVLPFHSPVLLVDAGATVQCRPQDLLNFAILGSIFARRYFGLQEARVGLINVGEEPGKGNELTKEAYGLLQQSTAVHFVGNIEGRDIAAGAADVLVTDGFTGNVVLKTAEGVASEVLGMIRSAMTGNALDKLAAARLRPRLVGVRDGVDPENYGGSFLLGVRGSVVIGHGNSRARGVKNALIGISRTGSDLSDELEAALNAASGAAPAGEPA